MYRDMLNLIDEDQEVEYGIRTVNLFRFLKLNSHNRLIQSINKTCTKN